MSAWEVYLLLKLDAIRALLIALAIISFIISVIASMIEPTKEISEKDLTLAAKYSLIVGLISFFFFIVTPSTKQAIAMYVVPKITKGQVSENIATYLEQYLDIKLKDIKSEINKHE